MTSTDQPSESDPKPSEATDAKPAKKKLTPEQRQAQQEKQRRERDDAKLVHLTFTTRWPAVFSATDPKPLKVGIYEDLRENVTKDISGIRLRRAIRHWTQSDAYKEAVANGKFRFDLKGNQCEPLSEDDKQHARDALSRREQARKRRQQQRRKPRAQESKKS